MKVVLKIWEQPSEPEDQKPLKPIVLRHVTYTKS